MPRDSVAVLGIDAAWTDGQPSGVALLQRQGGRWRCVRAAPSGRAFCRPLTCEKPISPGLDVPEILATCAELLDDVPLAAVAVDMPVATRPIIARRCSDDAVSRQFGHRKCAVHSPTPQRPGATGRRLQQAFADAGYGIATMATEHHGRALLEVYPHVALLGLTGRTERLPCKASKTNTYWPSADADKRKTRLISEWRFILDRLAEYVDDVDVPLVGLEAKSFHYLKRFEDTIDALVCAWVAAQHIDDAAVPLGDDKSAIWIPRLSMQFAKNSHAA